MGEAVSWWVTNKMGMTQPQFESLIGTSGLNLNKTLPNDILPVLLSNIQNPPEGIKKEVYVMLIAYRLRNYAGHNLNQQTILSTKFNEILTQLFFSLFLVIQSL